MSDETKPPARKPGPNTVAGEQARNQLGRWAPDDNRRGLTELQAKFAVFYAKNGGNARAAAEAAGYSPDSASVLGARLVKLPWVARAIELERKAFLGEAELASLGYVVGVIRDEAATPALRLKAAEVALKAVARERGDGKNTDGAGKRLAEMSVAELEALVRRLNQAAEMAQHPILEHEPAPAADNEPQPLDNPPQVIDPAGESTAL